MIKKKYPWSCVSCACAIALDISEEAVFKVLGHTGGSVVRPHLGNLCKYKGFQLQEVINSFTFKVGIPTVFVDLFSEDDFGNQVYSDTREQAFDKILKSGRKGILYCRSYSADSPHTLAFRDGIVYGPDTGEEAQLDKYKLFYALVFFGELE